MRSLSLLAIVVLVPAASGCVGGPPEPEPEPERIERTRPAETHEPSPEPFENEAKQPVFQPLRSPSCGPVPDPWEGVSGPVPDPWQDPVDDAEDRSSDDDRRKP